MSQVPPGAAIDSFPKAAMWSLRRASSSEISIVVPPPWIARAASTRSMIDLIGIAAYQTWSASHAGESAHPPPVPATR